ncbi:aminotransferase class I/II-fold pyridoxal phosphate-dependent enzyme [Shinella sp. AETb1-6]|jgi:DNA-binding transcriptional MocR family regulator|uniref:aminotransferase-like domain-containing protein n=1 Tax=Shinella TaxID=323620 RepID=UPI00106DE401|nr:MULTISPECIES: PLP-dependent aminotransferase family protein [Shinella]MDP9591153.1 DNA-binding transcriptional MocR family regulator [Shinella zoogloeoides]MCD1266541.1 aminotransferase class I/II-fold pyridoxal phosphate-dependent enzyme [Shinella sumterensis]MXN53616.1 aminotransferase class I/II-fold pyridoxal phosphate-dependent enzyme [Shinella sp. AETb1-6]TFE96758.1 GntR family transcriptional regulator [Shinella sumterensis]WLS08219.1 PLP-dependent aminotransferase family protein [Sh
MTNWLPNLQATDGPLYVRIADQIEQAIGIGALPAGSKLPPQRNLAYDIGVTIGTVSRAYAMVRERGLVSGEVGRGTYVLGSGDNDSAAAVDTVSARLIGTRASSAPPGKLRFDTTAATNVGQSSAITDIVAAICREQPSEIASYTRSFPADWLEAGRRWLKHGDWQPGHDSIVPTLGAHAAVIAAVSVITAPGDRIVFEHVTYSQVSRGTALIGRQSVLVDSDADGVLPDDFERVCVQQHPKLAFLMSSAQNPTLATMPEDRRRAIAAIAKRHNVFLVEDNLYGGSTENGLPLIAELAPDRTFLVGGLSKSVAAGVRGGWIACPPHLAQRVRIAHKMVSGGLPFLLAELAARLVLSGTAEAIRARVSDEVMAREALVREIFAGLEFNSHPRVPFVWLKLPDPWLSGTFRQAAFAEDVLIDDEDEFKAGRSEKTFHRVRIGISSPENRQDVVAGLTRLRRLITSGPSGYDSPA